MDHSIIDARSLAFGRLIAARLRADPTFVAVAHENLDRWAATASPKALPPLDEWRRALRQGSLDEVVHLLTDLDERSTRLRQSNPFAGLLTPTERTAVLRQFHANDPAST